MLSMKLGLKDYDVFMLSMKLGLKDYDVFILLQVYNILYG